METLKTRQDEDSKRMLKDKKRREHELETYKKQTKEKEALTKKRIDDLETCNKTLTLNEEDTLQRQQQLSFDACLHGTLSNIKHMVNEDIKARDIKDRTPLFRYCESRVSVVDKIQYLVSHQADMNHKDSNNNTILHWACGFSTLSTVQYLAHDLHMDVNAAGHNKETQLFHCCQSSVSPVDKIQYLVSHQANINARDSINITILHLAWMFGTLPTVQYLVDELHMNVNTAGYNNLTPLFYCFKSSVSPVDKIQYLVSHQADINARDGNNNTMLHAAYGTLSTVQYLVYCLHLDVPVKNKRGETVLDYCRWSDTELKEKITYFKNNYN
ncbi:putative ankyrin repeat protein RF_0381 [Patella vulgata]|uniref:putative ankyrin repeat protein RF_0381 n=1 Tax=Patella vulgata TaxID=6465 RepID=UPI0024A91AA5|nr:putative ankyrin repeat protein RF_0381 [Patella vulgata]XP_050410367.2 putative ankyrin repeat protein RF_0381 [Patella vulgata]